MTSVVVQPPPDVPGGADISKINQKLPLGDVSHPEKADRNPDVASSIESVYANSLH